MRPPLDHIIDLYFMYTSSADVVGSDAHGTAFVLSFRLWDRRPLKLIYVSSRKLMLCSTVVVGGFFTSMSLMEGKGASGVADSLSTVGISSFLTAQSCVSFVFELTLGTQMYAPTLMRGWCVLYGYL